MYEWQQLIQLIVDEIDICIEHSYSEALTLRFLSRKLGYSEFYTTRKFKEIAGVSFRDYLWKRKLAFALKEVRDSEKACWLLPLSMAFLLTKRLLGPLRKFLVLPPVNTEKILNQSFFGQKSWPLTATF